jgi:hypothetical protein
VNAPPSRTRGSKTPFSPHIAGVSALCIFLEFCCAANARNGSIRDDRKVESDLPTGESPALDFLA